MQFERYGKKYAWIAYYEIYGYRYAQGILPGYRPGDAGIDPSFPPEGKLFDRPIPSALEKPFTSAEDWICRREKPSYQDQLEIPEIDGMPGPWVMLSGFVEQNSTSDPRQVTTFIRGLLVDTENIDALCQEFNDTEYPGNSAIPDEPQYYYTFAGEMPLTKEPGIARAGNAEVQHEDCTVSSDRWDHEGVKVEIPVQRYEWERHHSLENLSSDVMLPSKSICSAMGLQYKAGGWELFDERGVASAHRDTLTDEKGTSGQFCYIRRDVIDRYLSTKGKSLVWLIWGERIFHYSAIDSEEWGNTISDLQQRFQNHEHVHKKIFIYQPAE